MYERFLLLNNIPSMFKQNKMMISLGVDGS